MGRQQLLIVQKKATSITGRQQMFVGLFRLLNAYVFNDDQSRDSAMNDKVSSIGRIVFPQGIERTKVLERKVLLDRAGTVRCNQQPNVLSGF